MRSADFEARGLGLNDIVIWNESKGWVDDLSFHEACIDHGTASACLMWIPAEFLKFLYSPTVYLLESEKGFHTATSGARNTAKLY